MTEVDAVRVLAAVIERDGRWLVGRRPEGKRHGGLWEFPGGKLHRGETLLDAARRELAEELALRALSLGRTLFTARDGDAPFVIDFTEVVVAGAATAIEHSEIAWLGLPELEALPLAPADRAFVAWLARGPGSPHTMRRSEVT